MNCGSPIAPAQDPRNFSRGMPFCSSDEARDKLLRINGIVGVEERQRRQRAEKCRGRRASARNRSPCPRAPRSSRRARHIAPAICRSGPANLRPSPCPCGAGGRSGVVDIGFAGAATNSPCAARLPVSDGSSVRPEATEFENRGGHARRPRRGAQAFDKGGEIARRLRQRRGRRRAPQRSQKFATVHC